MYLLRQWDRLFAICFPEVAVVWLPFVFALVMLVMTHFVHDDALSIYRVSFATSCVCKYLVALSCSSNSTLRSIVLLQFPSNMYSKAAALLLISCVAIFVVLLTYTPNAVITIYGCYIAPLYGSLWLIYQAFALFRIGTFLNYYSTNGIRKLAVKAQLSNRDFLLAGSAASAPKSVIRTIRLGRILSVFYIIFFCFCLAVVLAPWRSGSFISMYSYLLMLLCIIITIGATYTSLHKLVNRGLLLCSLFLLYSGTVVLSILLLDTSYNSLSDSALSVYANANDIRLLLIYISALWFSVVHFKECSINDVYSGLHGACDLGNMYLFSSLRNYSSGLLKRAQDRSTTQDIISYNHNNSNSNIVTNEIDSEKSDICFSSGSVVCRGADTGSSCIGDDSIEYANSSDVGLLEEGQLGVVRVGLLGIDKVQETSEDDGTNTNTNTNTSTNTNSNIHESIGPYISAHYARMVLFVSYTALLLTRWHSPQSINSEYTHFLTSEGKQTSQESYNEKYFKMILLSLSWVCICALYVWSLYSTYMTNKKYHEYKNALFEKEFGHSMRSEHISRAVDADLNSALAVEQRTSLIGVRYIDNAVVVTSN